MGPILLKLLPLLQTPALYLGGLAIAAGGTALIAFLVKRRNTKALAGAVPVLEDIATAELKVLVNDLGDPKKIPADAAKAALDTVKADAGQLVATAKAEIDVLANPNPATTAVTDGGATVNLPKQ